jgi:hypothetical protein
MLCIRPRHRLAAGVACRQGQRRWRSEHKQNSPVAAPLSQVRSSIPGIEFVSAYLRNISGRGQQIDSEYFLRTSPVIIAVGAVSNTRVTREQLDAVYSFSLIFKGDVVTPAGSREAMKKRRRRGTRYPERHGYRRSSIGAGALVLFEDAGATLRRKRGCGILSGICGTAIERAGLRDRYIRAILLRRTEAVCRTLHIPAVLREPLPPRCAVSERRGYRF